MKCNILSKIKIALVAVLVILLAGAVVFGIFGLNETADYKDGYELSVGVDVNIGNASTVLKDSTDAYLSSKGVDYADYALEKLDDAGTLIIKFTEDVSSKIDLAELEKAVVDAMQQHDILKGLTVEASYYERTSLVGDNTVSIIIGLGIAIVIAFIYALFMEKLSGGLTTVILALGSALLFFALIAITRVPARPFVYSTAMTAGLLGAVYSIGMVNRFNQTIKNTGNKDLKAIAVVGTNNSALRVAFISIALILFGVAFIAIGTAYLRFLGIQIILAAISSAVSAIFFTGYLWSNFKGFGKKKYVADKPAEDASL